MIDILAVGAHPDDVDFACGAILAKMSEKKKKIVILDFTLGDKGSYGTEKIRAEEGQRAASIIGAERVHLGFKDCQVFDTYEGRLKIVKVIREYKPKLLLAPLWYGDQTHPDHIACGILTRHATRYSRYQKILPDIPIHIADGILHYLPYGYEKPDFLVDITDYADIWKQMMLCHESQMETFNYADWNMRVAAKLGMLIDRPFAQGLVKGTPVVLEDIMSVSKGAREI